MITFPRTDLMSVRYANAPLRLVPQQELSTIASGVSIGKDLGPALWFGDFTTVALGNDDALAFEALLNSLDGVVQTFEAYDVRRPYPRAHADGAFTDSATLASVNANNKALALAGLASGFALSVGDYLSFDYGSSRALHQVMEPATVGAGGVTPQFEVRPHIRPGFTAGAAVRLKKPAGLFTLLPGSVSPPTKVTARTMSLSFKIGQYLP